MWWFPGARSTSAALRLLSRTKGAHVVEKWQRKEQKAELSQAALLVCHHKEASPALLVKCGVKGDTRSPPAKSQQRSRRIICWFQVHASHYLVMWQRGQPFRLSQRPMISGAKCCGAICCITYRAVRWETVWEKSACYLFGQLRNFKENFQILFFFSSGLLKESWFRAKTPRSELRVFFICTMWRFVCAEQGANRSGSKKKQKVEQEVLLPTTAITHETSALWKCWGKKLNQNKNGKDWKVPQNWGRLLLSQQPGTLMSLEFSHLLMQAS